MGKLKDALIGAQEYANIISAHELMLWCAHEALTKAINNPEPDEGLACAEQALHLLNTYLMETELCKQ